MLRVTDFERYFVFFLNLPTQKNKRKTGTYSEVIIF